MKNAVIKKTLSIIMTMVMVIGVCLPITSIIEANAETIGKTIEILSLNDFHGSLAEEAGEKGKNLGMAKLVTMVKQYKAENPNTIVVSAGDNYQGSAMSNLTYGAPVSAMFKEMDLITSAVGNHEFDWGIDKAEQWQKDGDFKFVAANIVDKTTKQPVSWAEPYVITEVDGVKVAFIGLSTPQTSYQTSADKVKNYDFLDVKETAEKWAKVIRDEKKADVVIALAHVGAFQDRDTKEITGEIVDTKLVEAEGIDAIICGHSHQTVAGMVKDMPVVQAYKNGRCIGKLTIKLSDKNEVLSIEPTVDQVYNQKSSLIEDPTTKKSFEEFSTKLDPIMSEVVGKTDIELAHDRSANGVSVLGYLISDIIRKNVDAQVGIVNSGGIRNNIPKGEITMGKMYEILPFDNTVVKMTLTGEQLKKVLNNGINNEKIGWVETAGVKVEIDLSKPFGDRIADIYLEDGTKVEMDKEYTVATIDFLSTGGDQYDFSNAKDVKDTFIPMRDVVVDYLKANNPVNFTFTQPLVEGKITDTATSQSSETPTSSEVTSSTEASQPTEATPVEKSNSTTVWVVVILLIVVAGIVVFVVMKNKKEKK